MFVTIIGEKGDSGERPLKKSQNFNKFERGQEDTFSLEIMELGKIQSVKIRHDNKGGRAGWFLDHLKLTSQTLEEPLAFPCKRWLATDEDDGQIERTLVPLPGLFFYR